MGVANKVRSAAAAIAELMPDGAMVAVGGMHMHNNPMTLVRELVRQKKRIGRLLTSPSACINADLLLGAGLVDEIMTSYVGFEHLGLSLHYRRAVEQGQVRLLEVDEPFIVHGLYAGAGGLPFVPMPRGLELTDLPRINPDSYKFVTDPYTGQQVMTAMPLVPDVALVHVQEADVRGNCAFLGSHFTDRLMAMAAKKVIVQTERIVAEGRIAAQGPGAALPAFLVAAVVEAPGGCHPTASHGNYTFDEPHLKGYIKACKDPETFAAYLQQYVPADAREEEYVGRLESGRLESLAQGVVRHD